MIASDDIAAVQRACWAFAEDEEEVGRILGMICRAAGHAQAVMAVYEQKTGRFQSSGAARVDPVLSALAARRRDTPEWHPAPRALARMRVGRLDHHAQVFDLEAVQRSDFHHEFWRPAGLGHAGSFVLPLPNASLFYASIGLPAGENWLTARDASGVEMMFDALARAARVRTIMETDRTRARLDGAMPDAAFLVSPRGMLRQANCASDALFADGVFERIGSRISPGDPERVSDFVRGLEAVAVGGRARPMVLRQGNRFLCLEMVQGPSYKLGRTVLVTIRSPRPLEWTVEGMARELGLTRREASVVLGLTEGAPTDRIAERMGIAPASVRLYLKRVYSKLGVGGQAELVQFVLRGCTLPR